MSRCIDADTLKKDLTRFYDNEVTAKRLIDEQPTIEPRKKGKWIPDNNSLYEMRFVCSECKESQVVPTIGFTKYKPIWEFCPICGAEMLTEDSECQNT